MMRIFPGFCWYSGTILLIVWRSSSFRFVELAANLISATGVPAAGPGAFWTPLPELASGANTGGGGAGGETALSPGLTGAALAASGTGGGGGGGAGADTAGKPARKRSSLYFAFVRSAIRFCDSFSRSAVVSARFGGGGTLARLG